MIPVLSFVQIGPLTPLFQIFLIAALFVITALDQSRHYATSGRMWTYYPVMPTLLVAPIYEEVLFRGLLLATFASMYHTALAILFTSLLFGIWHLKNLFFLPAREVVRQIVYTGCFVAPLLSVVTITTGTVWVAVILHYIHNLIASHCFTTESLT
jgi:membrane protease YdiL (CAAX protease family)